MNAGTEVHEFARRHETLREAGKNDQCVVVRLKFDTAITFRDAL
jgi:hypothetical protein